MRTPAARPRSRRSTAGLAAEAEPHVKQPGQSSQVAVRLAQREIARLNQLPTGHHAEGELARWVCARCGVLQRLNGTADRGQVQCVSCGVVMTTGTAEQLPA
jgi:hypothetical protein